MYTISVGKSRTDTKWESRQCSWEQLCERLSKPKRTFETMADYKAMSRIQKGRVKDCGGFVGGELIEAGARKASTIKNRSLLTLDIDYGQADTIGIVEDMLAGTQWCLYSTHSHTPEAPRYRLIVPLSKAVDPDVYIPIARRIADNIGINIFDDSTYEPSRLMYWPSAAVDGEFVFRQGDGDPLDVGAVMKTYVDWKNVEEWPISKRVQRLAMPNGKKQEDPTTKPGLIGAFCRCYTISDAIATFLPDVYEPTAQADRYTFIGGTTEAGLVVYEDKFAYSHHGTDPICSKEVNAFDLVRIHKFGPTDADADSDTPVNRLPSFKAMEEFVRSDKRVSKILAAEKAKELMDDFGDYEPDEEMIDLVEALRKDKKDEVLSCPYNFELIARHDPMLKGATKYDVFEDKNILMKDLPWAKISPEHKYWNDMDDAGLIGYISERYRVSGKQAIIDAHDLVMSQCSYHPVREYLDELKWDGEPRLDTMLTDYLGAADNELTRAMCRKHFTAAAARIFEPGIKYDYVLTLTGPEGIGKSTLLKRMGLRWFDDSFSSNDVGDKSAMEQVRGRWLIELGELKEYKRSTVEAFKAFISKQVDQYRPAYGRKVVSLPRQCVFFATTNETNFLKGDTGNRRFWAVEVNVITPKKSVFELDRATIDQIWAEAVVRYREGEQLFLERELEAQAKERQANYNEVAADERLGLIEAYLNTPLPSCWWSLTRKQRADWFRCNNKLDEGDTGMRRTYVCAMEVATECFFKDVTRYEAKEINQMLERLGLINRGAMRTTDAAYGNQRRWQIPSNFYATIDCGAK